MPYWIHPLSILEPNLILFSAEEPSLRFLINADILNHNAARELAAADPVVALSEDDGLEMRLVHLYPQEMGQIIKTVYDDM